MYTGSLCLSGNNDSWQVRCAQTKAQKIKGDLKVYLQGVLYGSNSIADDGISLHQLNCQHTHNDVLQQCRYQQGGLF